MTIKWKFEQIKSDWPKRECHRGSFIISNDTYVCYDPNVLCSMASYVDKRAKNPKWYVQNLIEKRLKNKVLSEIFRAIDKDLNILYDKIWDARGALDYKTICKEIDRIQREAAKEFK